MCQELGGGEGTGSALVPARENWRAATLQIRCLSICDKFGTANAQGS